MATTEGLVDLIGPDVAHAVTQTNPARDAHLRRMARIAFELAYEDATRGTTPSAAVTRDFVASVAPAIAHTGNDSEPELVAQVIAHAAANAAVVAASALDPDTKLTWLTRRDDRVRDLHVPLDGQVRAAGQPFDVGGFDLHYPGEPVGPPEVWINCRCTLVPGATITAPPVAAAAESAEEAEEEAMEDLDIVSEDAELTAAVSEEPWSNFSASDYSIEQWRRACLIKMPDGDPDSKSTYKLPIRTPSGALSRAGVHAAAAALAGARGGVSAPAAEKAKAKAKLRGAYKTLGEDPPESIAAAVIVSADSPICETVFATIDRDEPYNGHALVAWPKGTSPPGTHDAPGWITNPRETQRLRTYWTKGPGAGKIRWGAPGDFDRCRRQLGKYVQNPAHLAGTCANLHFVALGFWPGQPPHGRRKASVADAAPNWEENPMTAVFAAAPETDELPPLEWFQDPGFDAPTPLTITSDGRVLGHIATWGTCHVGVTGECMEPPRSERDYAYFRTGEVQTAGGPVSVGQITMDTGHAALDQGPTAAVAHYDDTGTGVCDVAAGEDQFGIWVAGQVRPGLSEGQLRALRAGAPSGDWRRIGGNLELVATLMVNVPGFPVPRAQVASAAGVDYALVAAGIVQRDPNAFDLDRVTVAVVRALDQREREQARAARARALTATIHDLRVEALTAAAR